MYMNTKNKFFAVFSSLLFLNACGDFSDFNETSTEQSDDSTDLQEDSESPGMIELGQIQEEMSIQNSTGWRNEQGWEHGRCRMQTTTHVCAFPSPDLSGQGLWRVLVNFPIESLTSAVGFNLGTARQYSLGYINAATINWNFVQTTQGVGAKLIIGNDDSIYNGTPPNATIDLSSIAHIACTDYGVTLNENWGASAFQCDVITIGFDYNSFMAWVNQWATNNNQKQQALNSLFVHFNGVAMGLGSHSAGDTAMRARLSRAQSPITITSYEVCLANHVNFADTIVPDPSLGVHTQDCVSP